MSKILVVIDMQNDFITGPLGSVNAQQIVPRIREKILDYDKNEDVVVFTRDTHGKNYLKTLEGKYLPIPHCIEGTVGWKISDELLGLATNHISGIFNKYTFGSIDLAKAILADKFDEIEIVGLVSSICVISNALLMRAFMPNKPITVDASCTAGVTDVDYQASLCVMKMNNINIINEVKE